MYDAIYAAAAFVLCWALTGLVLRGLTRAQSLALPSERGLHTKATPVGGGLALIATIAILWPMAKWPLSIDTWTIVACTAALSLFSWIDDRRPLWPITRLLIQAVAVAVALSTLPATERLTPEMFQTAVPVWAERGLLGLAWLWMINLYNFMDGIDGLAGVETVTVAAGVALVAAYGTGLAHLSLPASILAAAAVGYLLWNWHPARIFMGDAGSIPLGFLIGWMMLELTRHGYLAAAIILPLYFLVDATWTLLRRVLRGETPWRPHREHAYQRAVLGGESHAAVARSAGIANMALAGLAWLSIEHVWEAAVLAAAVVAILMARLEVSSVSTRTARPDVDGTPAE
jgi:UDP-N-acetylmuramyl pentapeptide phosphotransferase/UDP-N-acetylglucosamine-1-phosphate transferase